MSSRPDVGILVPIADINHAFEGLKIRSVGFLESYEAHTARGVMVKGDAHLSVDFSLVSESLKMSSLTASPKIMVIGTLYRSFRTQEAASMTLQAVHVAIVEGLDLALWERAAREHSRAMQHRITLAIKS